MSDRTPSAGRPELGQLARGAGLALAGKIVGRGFHVGLQVILARLLGPGLFGLYAIGWTLVRVSGVVLPLGLDQGALRFGSTAHAAGDRWAFRAAVMHALGLAFTSGVIAGSGLWLGSDWIAASVFDKPDLGPVLRGFAFALPFLAALRVATSATLVSKSTVYAVLAEDIAQPIAGLAAIGVLSLLAVALTPATAARAIASAHLPCALLAVGFLLWLFPALRFGGGPAPAGNFVRGLGPLIAFSLPAMSAGMFTMLMIWADRLFVGRYLPASSVGIYQAASQFSVAFAVIVGGFNAIVAPLAVPLIDRAETPRLQELYRVSTRWGLYLAAPVFATLVSAPGLVLTAFFGADYGAGAVPLTVLCGGQLVNVATGSVGLLLVLGGVGRRWFVWSMLVFGLNLGLNALLVPRFGLVGAATATGVGLTLLFGGGVVLARAGLGIWPYDRTFVKILVALVPAMAGAWLVANSGFGPPLVRVILVAIVAVVTFAGVTIGLGVAAADRQFVAHILDRLGGRSGRQR